MYEGEGILFMDPFSEYTMGEYRAGAYGWINLEPVTYTPSGSYKEAAEVSEGASVTYLFEEVHYRKDGVDAVYPHFISGASKEQMESWNRIIDADVQKIFSIYSFRPLPLPTPELPVRERAERMNASPTEEPRKADLIILRMTYEIKSADKDTFSVMYLASFNPEYVAHPTQLAYTTNIGLKDSKRLHLKDIVLLNEAFVEDFRHWDIVSTEPGNEEYEKEVRDYVDSLPDNELLIGFQTADKIASGNYLGIYSYQEPGRLGISLGVPNYLGDHAEFEKNMAELNGFILSDSPTAGSLIRQ
jgi:hypothetical protein